MSPDDIMNKNLITVCVQALAKREAKAREIMHVLFDYVEGTINGRAMSEKFHPLSLNVDREEDDDLSSLVYSVLLLLAEHSGGYLSEADLKAQIRDALDEYGNSIVISTRAMGHEMMRKAGMDGYGLNLTESPIHVRHASLERSDESAYRSECPRCDGGLLLVRRDEKTLAIKAEDSCTKCGQRFIYEDVDSLS